MRESKRRFVKPVVIEGARLILRNFQGRKDRYNREGDRNFGVLLSDQLAEELIEEGWNVKHMKPDESGYEQPWLKVKVEFGKYPPIAYLINHRGKIKLDEESIEQLDWTRIQNCDLRIRGYFPSDNPNYTGSYDKITAKLAHIYVTKEDDYLDDKYADIADIGE